MIWKSLQKNESIRTAYMPQDYTEGLPLTKTPVQFLQRSGDREEINTIQLHLASLNFTYSEMHHPIYELSGGQQGKLYLLQLVLTSPQFLLLDEPTRNFFPHFPTRNSTPFRRLRRRTSHGLSRPDLPQRSLPKNLSSDRTWFGRDRGSLT